MAQERRRNNNRRRASQRRRAYDQARDPQRRPQQRRRTQGYQETTLDLATGQVSHNTQAARQNAARRPDNSIQFPQQQRRNPNHNNNQRPQSGQTARRRSGSNQNQRNPQRLRPTEANLRSPSRREGKKRRKLTRAAIRRRRIIRRLTAFALLLCVIAAGVYLTMTMLFKISSIQVQTADGAQVSEAGGYTSEQILQALGVHAEENIFSFDPAQKSQELEKVFPMLEFIHVQRQYPGTVVVQVTEAQPAYAMQTDSGWLTLSGSLKIIAKDSAQPAGLATLYGGEPVSTNPGDQLEFAAEAVADSAASAASDSASSEAAQPAEDKRLASLTELMDALNTHGMLGDVTRIEFADPEQMAFLYQNRISVLLGTLNELEYKLKLADYVLLNQDGKGCAETDTGLLDLSHLSASTTRKFRFAQGEPTLPSGFVVTDPPTNQAQPEAEPTAEPTEDSTENAETVENPEQATPEAADPNAETTDPAAAPAETPAEAAPAEAAQ